MDTVTKLALANDKKNRTRSILVIISICITTMLLTAIATVGYGTVKSNRVNAGELYGSYYGSFNGVDKNQLKEMKLRSEFTEIGTMAVLGTTDSDGKLRYADDVSLEMTNMSGKLTKGSFPKEGNEIAATPSFFKSCGIENPRLGETVKVNYRRNLSTPYGEETFVISGMIKEEKESVIPNLSAFVSKEYYQEKVSEESRTYIAYFRLDKSVDINADNGEETLKELAKKCGVDTKAVSDNYAYLMWALDPGLETMAVCIVIMFAVVLLSIVVIYNIFQVGIVQKVQEYGKVRALGATRKQMKTLIWREGMFLGLVGIPAGLVLGYGTAEGFFAWLMKLSEESTHIHRIEVSLFSPTVLLAVALICFLTVWASLKKPMKTVANISPVEAMRYQEENSKKKKKGIRKGKKDISVLGLTRANLASRKKRTIQTIVTMGLSCVLFVVMANFAGNMDAEYDAKKSVESGKFEIALDYSMNDTAYPENNLESILKENPIDEELIKKIQQIEGVKEVKTRPVLLLKTTDKNGKEAKAYQSIEVLDREAFEWEKEQGSTMGTLDYEKASKNDEIIYGWSYWWDETGLKMGEKTSFILSDGTESKTMDSVVRGSFGAVDTDWVMTEDTYEKLGFQTPTWFKVWVDCEKDMEKNVEAELKELLSEKEHLQMQSYEQALKISENSILMMKTMSYSLTAMIAVISFLNMANTLIASVVIRKQEFGMLQAIGMTDRQLNMSLQAEGIIFTAGTVIVAMLVGVPAGYGVFRYGRANGWLGLYKYHLPIKELLVLIVFLVVFQVILSLVLTRSQKKESLVERISYQG